VEIKKNNFRRSVSQSKEAYVAVDAKESESKTISTSGPRGGEGYAPLKPPVSVNI